MNITVLNNDEEFIQFLDPELCEMTETIEKGGLRTLSFTYYFQDMIEDKKLFKIGNKLWISGDSNFTDCLYVINTSVVQDIYQENCFKCEMEEVLVELNYAPLFTQNELTTSNGFTFTTENSNTEYSVLVNWNALNYWFGEYFNIGVVQKCLSDYNAKIGLSGTINLMTLLRYIEEETGNIFVTRYEKDCLNNTIHRYLDFLNPINVSKPWILNLEYDFLDIDNTSHIYDENDDPTSDEYDDVEDKDDIVTWDDDYTPVVNIDPTNIQFQITNDMGEVLGVDGLVYTGEDETIAPLLWTSEDIELENEDQCALISLQKEADYIGMTVNEKEFVLLDEQIIGDIDKSYTTTDNIVKAENKRSNPLIPDDAWLEMYDTVNEIPIFRTQINREIGHVHEEILDFGFNVDNIELEIDETETFTAISPVLSLENNEELNRNDMTKIINYWRNFEVEKGQTVPMIMEKITVTAASLSAAKAAMGTSTWDGNYWSRPYHPQDNIDTDTPANSTWEFWKGTAYWKAPYSKKEGDLHVTTDAIVDTNYTHIQGRPDTRDGRDIRTSRPKMGTVETSDETVFAIYNDVCNKLREKQYPEFNITVDVANLRDGEYNNYQIHDKVYVKIPDMNELLTARVIKTTKEGHDVAKNTIELSNYSVNTVKQIQSNTFIEASNTSFKYPNVKDYACKLVNMDYDSEDPNSIQYPANKLLTFQVYEIDENGNTSITRTTYSKVTDAYGQVTIPLKFDPGNYELAISFGGDEEYLDCAMSIEVNVSGTKQAKETATTTTKTKTKTSKQKTTKKTAKKKTSTKKKTNAAKKNTSTKARTITGNPSSYVRKLALNIVGDSTGLAAAKKIVKYVDNHVKYELYANFHKSPDKVLKSGKANCCDQARTVLTLCDAAGCTSSLTLKYVHVHSGSKGHVFCRIITNSSGKWRYVDTCKWGGKSWGNYVHGYGTPPGSQSTYPTLPF